MNMRRAAQLLVALALAVGALLPGPIEAQTTPSSASPSPGPPSSTVTLIPFLNRKVLYVVGIGGDPATRAKFISLLTAALQSPRPSGSATGPLFGRRLVVPESDWAVSDYLNACQTFPSSTLGAMIVAVTSISTGAKTFFIGRNSWTDLSAALFYADCDPLRYSGSPQTPKAPPRLTSSSTTHTLSTVTATEAKIKSGKTNRSESRTKTWQVAQATPGPTDSPSPTPPPSAILWSSNVHTGRGSVPFLTPLPALGVLLTLISAYTALAPSRTVAGVTTTIFPTPRPKQLWPPEGVVSQNQVTNTTTTNVSQENAVASAFFAQSLTYNSSVTSIPVSDEQTVKAAKMLVPALLDELRCTPASLTTQTALLPNTPPSLDWVCSHIYEPF